MSQRLKITLGPKCNRKVGAVGKQHIQLFMYEYGTFPKH
jgi:hypothetical protein